ncbi:MAG: hypothetical protein M1818_008281 [Claussenomyces sp. TS43310]|nr:MAG: hypothetical protein M1818_008281 [Claussenomyces sp. TS43310]
MSPVSILSAVAPIHGRTYAAYTKLSPSQDNLRSSLHENFKSSFPAQSERPRERGEWSASPPQPAPSLSEKRLQNSFEMLAARSISDYQMRPEIKAVSSREQLPPLSSILGEHRPGLTSTPATAPGRSPASFPDHSPSSYSVTSSHDSRRDSTPTGRQLWDPLRPQPSGVSPLYSYENRAAQKVNAELRPLTQPPSQLHMKGVESPQSRESRYRAGDHAALSHATTGHWSPRSEPAHREYFPESRDSSSSFRPQLDSRPPLPPLKPPGDSEASLGFRDAHHAAPLTPTYPLAPSGTTAGPVTSKDGLGPKIWTGTQFLPRFVRQAELPGEGTCYFYDDGTHCKTNIDGEPVNAHWGVTKAGKPRKRLAIACITCREKKIKCDPDYPRCVQCEKFGRLCKFKNAPRGCQGSKETSPAEADDYMTRPRSQRSDDDSYKSDAQSVSPRTIVNHHPPPEIESPAAKRRRNEYNEFTPVTVSRDHQHPLQLPSPISRDWGRPDFTINVARFQWPTNPLDKNEDLVKELMDIYFANIESTTYSIFPQGPFMRWLTDRRIAKSEDDILLIYALLAVATIFSPRADSRERGIDFSAASSVVFSRDFSLQIVQSRFLFALYFDSIDQSNHAWDALGAAIRAAMGIDLHLELPSLRESQRESSLPFDFPRAMYAECRRRTFWSCYLMDRLGACRDGRSCTIHTDDIFLRMPCDNKSYREEHEVTNPFFDPTITLSQNARGTYGVMAYLVSLCSIWGDIMNQIYREAQRARKLDLMFYDSMSSRLESWHTTMPPCIAYSQEFLDKQVDFGLLGSFMTMHAIYHTAAMKLNTAGDTATLPNVETDYRARCARKHAEAVLRLAHDQATIRSCNPRDPARRPPVILGYAISMAVEIVVRGRLSDMTVARVDQAISVLDELAQTWPAVARQRADVSHRLGWSAARPST